MGCFEYTTEGSGTDSIYREMYSVIRGWTFLYGGPLAFSYMDRIYLDKKITG